MSVIFFAVLACFDDPGVGSSFTPEAKQERDHIAAAYRVIKTPQTFLAERKLRHTDEDQARRSEPPTKIPRTDTIRDTSEKRRKTAFATGPASLRRAASLRSDVETDDEVRYCYFNHLCDYAKSQPIQGRTPTTVLVPTAPATPHSHAPGARSSRFGAGRVPLRWGSPVPIIAPPADHVARLPLSEEASAKLRLQRLLERERRVREHDGLEGGGDRRRRVARRVGRDEDSSNDCSEESESDDESDDGGYDAAREWEAILDIGESVRRDVVRWILEVGHSSLLPL